MKTRICWQSASTRTSGWSINLDAAGYYLAKGNIRIYIMQIEANSFRYEPPTIVIPARVIDVMYQFIKENSVLRLREAHLNLREQEQGELPDIITKYE